MGWRRRHTDTGSDVIVRAWYALIAATKACACTRPSEPPLSYTRAAWQGDAMTASDHTIFAPAQAGARAGTRGRGRLHFLHFAAPLRIRPDGADTVPLR